MPGSADYTPSANPGISQGVAVIGDGMEMSILSILFCRGGCHDRYAMGAREAVSLAKNSGFSPPQL